MLSASVAALLATASSLAPGAQAAVTETFSTGASSFVVPTGITSLQVHAVGGQGSRGYLNAPIPGRAAVVDGTLAVTPGSTLHLFTAGNGRQCGGGDDGAGYNGGGRPSNPCVFAGGGGGGSDIRTTAGDLSTRVLVAGGGGGAGDYGSGADAGAAAQPDTQGCSPAGQAGTAIAGGAGGGACGANPVAGTAGTFGQGGDAGYRSDTRGNVENSGGGGGGGWYGGGGGSVYGGGGGGSSHTTAAVTGVQTSLAPLGSTPVITLTYPGLALTVATAGTGAGYVDAPSDPGSSPAALDCGRNTPGVHTDCAKEYRPGASVTLTAHPAANADFAGFTGGCVDAGTTCTTTVAAAKTVTATFTLKQRTVTASTTGAGAGTVTGGGLDCGGAGHTACTTTVTDGDAITLTATAATGSTFGGFTGGGCSTSPCTITVTADTSVSAAFTLQQRALSVATAGDGAGSVDSAPTGIDCQADCSELYDYGTPVTLTAHPAAGSRFAGWDGAGCSGTGTCIVSMTDARSVQATFSLVPVSAAAPTVTALSPGSGPAGTSVTITGTNFGSTSAVLFGDRHAAFAVDGFGQITAVAPDGQTGVADVLVVGPGGTSRPTGASEFTYIDVAVAPSTAPLPVARRVICARIPTLVGRTIRQARATLARDGCAVIRVERVGKKRKRTARIAAQSVEPGTPVFDGDPRTVSVRVGRPAA